MTEQACFMDILAVAYSGHTEALVSLGEWDVQSFFSVACKKFYIFNCNIFSYHQKIGSSNIKTICKALDHVELPPTKK